MRIASALLRTAKQSFANARPHTEFGNESGRCLFPAIFSWCLTLLLVLTPALPGDDEVGEPEKPPVTTGENQSAKELFRGKVVLLPDALKKRDIRAAEEMKDHVVLESDAGELIPILADWRGRAFYQDERLRDRNVELVGFRRDGVPYLQVLMVFTFDEEGKRQYTDYWCDICAIPMYEIQPCECCQGDIRLRFQPRELPGYLKTQTTPDTAGE